MRKSEFKAEIRRLSRVKSPFNKNIDFEKVPLISKKEANEIKRYVKSTGGEIYGSLAATSFNPYASRTPGDADIAVRNPRVAAEYIFRIISRRHGVGRTDKAENAEYGSYQIKVYTKDGWETVVDIQPLRIHQNQRFEHISSRSMKPVRTPDGTLRQRSGDQLLRKANSVLEGFKGREHREEKDKVDFALSARLALDSEQFDYDNRQQIGSLLKKDNDYQRFYVGKKIEELNSKEAIRSFLLRDPIPQEIEQRAAFEKNKKYRNTKNR